MEIDRLIEKQDIVMEIDLQIDTETWILLWRLTYRLIQKHGYCYGD